MKLKDLVKGFSEFKIFGSKEIEITGISADSRITAPGNLFIAKRGCFCNGGDFIAKAVEAGASAILTPIYNPFLKLTQIVCKAPELFEAKIAARYYRYPSKALWIAGVTGSKGKTTTSYCLRHLLECSSRPCGLLSTVETIIGERCVSSVLTTHDAILNQKLLREMVESKCKAAVLEVSSHGLAQRRVDEIDFDLALFTNLYPDHLDYHKTIEAYALEKKKLFAMAPIGIYNADSSWTPFMREGRPGLTFGMDAEADIRAEEIRFDSEGTSFRVQKEPFRTPFFGKHNVSNVLGAIAVGVHLGMSLSQLAAIFANVPAVPGRLEPVSNDLGIRVFIDYAHTGEALETVLRALRDTAPKKIIVVFGCGGGRDPARRPAMGLAASQWADLVMITTDNPRNEDPREICGQILSGCKDKTGVIVEMDRRSAIQKAIDAAEKGDLVLIAGKGHEKMQILSGQSVPFDDLDVAKQALQIRQSSATLQGSKS